MIIVDVNIDVGTLGPSNKYYGVSYRQYWSRDAVGPRPIYLEWSIRDFLQYY